MQQKVFTLILLKHRSSSLKCSARRSPNLHQEEWRLLYLASVFDITDFNCSITLSAELRTSAESRLGQPLTPASCRVPHQK